MSAQLHTRSRHFSVTVNNPKQTMHEFGESLRLTGFFSYVCGQLETAPETGTPHLQCMVSVPNPKSILRITKMIPGAHIEVCRDAAATSEYCQKEESRAGDEPPYTWGDPPLPHVTKKSRDKSKTKEEKAEFNR